jgi:hypothetical protein
MNTPVNEFEKRLRVGKDRPATELVKLCDADFTRYLPERRIFAARLQRFAPRIRIVGRPSPSVSGNNLGVEAGAIGNQFDLIPVTQCSVAPKQVPPGPCRRFDDGHRHSWKGIHAYPSDGFETIKQWLLHASDLSQQRFAASQALGLPPRQYGSHPLLRGSALKLCGELGCQHWRP